MQMKSNKASLYSSQSTLLLSHEKPQVFSVFFEDFQIALEIRFDVSPFFHFSPDNTRNIDSHVPVEALWKSATSSNSVFLCITYGSCRIIRSRLHAVQHRMGLYSDCSSPVWAIGSWLRTALHKLRAIMKLLNVGAFIASCCCHRVSALCLTHRTWRVRQRDSSKGGSRNGHHSWNSSTNMTARRTRA